MQMTSIEYLVEGWLEKKSNYLLSLSIFYSTLGLAWWLVSEEYLDKQISTILHFEIL